MRSYHLEPSPTEAYSGGAEKAFGANSAESPVGDEGRCQGAVAAAAEKGGPCLGVLLDSSSGLRGVFGRDTGPIRPGMFAVGGGTKPLWSPAGVAGPSFLGVDLRLEVPLGFPFGVGVPLYFSSSWCVVLYLVAVLSLSMVASLCFCSPSRCPWTFEVR